MERVVGDRVLRLWLPGGEGRGEYRSADSARMGLMIGQNDRESFEGLKGRVGWVL